MTKTVNIIEKGNRGVKLDLEIKIICGDNSDNIPSCFKRCGIKTALKLISNKDLLLKKFKKNPDSFTQYALNKILIDFNNIPENFVNKVNQYLNTIIN